MKNQFLKINHPFKLASPKKAAKVLAGTFATLLLSTVLATTIYSEFLPKVNNKKDANDFLVNNGYYNQYQSIDILSSNAYTATSAPVASDSVKFNIDIDNLTQAQIDDMQSVVDELNYVFENINPLYKFELNLNPTLIDFLNPVNVTVQYYNNAKQSDQHVEQGKEYWRLPFFNKNSFSALFQSIKLNLNSPDFNLKQIFMHEIMHYLGVGDTYHINADLPTIMDNSPQLRKNDIAVLASKYADFSTKDKEKEITNFIENYESATVAGQELEKKQNQIYNMLMNNLNGNYSQSYIEQLSFDLPENLYVIQKSYSQNSFNINLFKIEDGNIISEQISQIQSNFTSDKKIYNREISNDGMTYYADNELENAFLLYSKNSILFKSYINDNKLITTPIGTIVEKENFLNLQKQCEEYKSLDKEHVLEVYHQNLQDQIENIAQDNSLSKLNINDFNGKNITLNGATLTFSNGKLIDESGIAKELISCDYGLLNLPFSFYRVNGENIEEYSIDWTNNSLTLIRTFENDFDYEK